MLLYVTISNTSPFLLRADDGLHVQQYKDYVLQAYDSLYEHNTKLKFIRVVHPKTSADGEQALLFQFERHAINDGFVPRSEKENIALHVYAEGEERNEGEKPNVKYVRAAEMQPQIKNGNDLQTLITFTNDALLTQANINRMVITATDPHTSQHFRNVMLLSIRQYLRPEQFLTKLIQRFHLRHPITLSQTQQQQFIVNERLPIQRGVFHMLLDWIACYPEDCVGIVDKLMQFASTLTNPALAKFRGDLERAITSHFTLEGHDPHPYLAADRALVKAHVNKLFSGRSMPQSVLGQLKGQASPNTKVTDAAQAYLKAWAAAPWSTVYDKLTDPKSKAPLMDPGHQNFGTQLFTQSPDDIADVVTSLFYTPFQQITPRELVGKNWTTPDGHEHCPNVRAMIDISRTVENWVAVSVLDRADGRTRAWVYCNMVAVACRCYLMGNFSGLWAVLPALKGRPLSRLNIFEKDIKDGKAKKLLNNCSQQMKAAYDALLPIVSPETENYGPYRTELSYRALSDRTLPFIAMATKDCFWAEDGIPRIVNGNVNLSRGYRLYNSISLFLIYQMSPPYQKITNEFTEALRKYKIVDETDLYEKSYKIKERAGQRAR